MMFDNVSWPSSMFGWLVAAAGPGRGRRSVEGDVAEPDQRTQTSGSSNGRATSRATTIGAGTAVRGHYADVGVPVFVMSGWQDGYKNPVPLVVDGLAAEGKDVAGHASAPWGHKYPFGGYPGPRVDWLQYTVTHWWDSWLKGKTPPPARRLAELPVWLGEAKEPSKSLAPTRTANGWPRTPPGARASREDALSAEPGNRLGEAPERRDLHEPGKPVLDTEMLETSSWGECGNDDLPGDQARVRQGVALFRQRAVARGFRQLRLSRGRAHACVDRPTPRWRSG